MAAIIAGRGKNVNAEEVNQRNLNTSHTIRIACTRSLHVILARRSHLIPAKKT